MSDAKKISIIIPVCNETDVLPLLRDRLENVLEKINYDYEVIFVNDGSTDNSANIIKDWIQQNHRISLIEFSRNFGHQQAITAGLKESTGDAVIISDADLQDPPEEILNLIAKWQEGYKVVLAERSQRGEKGIRKVLFKLFYKAFLVLSDLPIMINSGVFGLIDRVIVENLILLEERNRYLPGLRGWIGFNSTTIYYKREARVAGNPKQSLRRLFKFGLNAIFSFSYKPLRISFVLGACVSTFFFLYGAILVIMRLFNINVVRGFTTPTVAIFFIGGVLLISNGIIGEYLARIYDEVKRRPLYIIAKKYKRNSENSTIEIKEIYPNKPC